MKAVRITSIGLLLSWIVSQIIFAPFTHYYINTKLFAFLSGWDAGLGSSPNYLNEITLFISVWCLSLGIGLFLSSCLYSPAETIITRILLKIKVKRSE